MSVFANNGMFVALSTLLAGENASFEETRISSCGRDANDSLSNGLFICLSADANGAREEVERASRNGAIVAVLPRSLASSFNATDQDLPCQTIFVDDPRDVYGRACHAFRGYPGRRMKLIGVTGSAGKTSLTYVLGGVLAEAGMRLGLIGSLGVYDGAKLYPTNATTPTPERLAELLDRMASAGCDCVIIEASSVGLAEKRLAGLELDAVCLTNLRRDHLDYHGSVDQYRSAKMQIFSYLKPSGIAVCNKDDRVTEAAMHLIDHPLLTVGIQPTTCSVSGTPVELLGGEQTFYIVAGSDAAPIRSKIVGKEHIYNSLEAAALALAWKIDIKTIARGVERVESIPGRMERVDCGQPFAVYLDRANSPDSLTSALETMRAVTRGSVYCVLCAPNDGDHSKRPLMARIAETNADFTVITSGVLAGTQTSEAFDSLRKGLVDADSAQFIEDRKDALVWALSHASVDDAVLVVSQDVSSYDFNKDYFVPDRHFIKSWLSENLASAESYWFN